MIGRKISITCSQETQVARWKYEGKKFAFEIYYIGQDGNKHGVGIIVAKHKVVTITKIGDKNK